MYLQEILEVVTGLIFMWMIISIAVMQINEWFFRKRRGIELQETITQMLGNQELADKFYNHPLISSLYKHKNINRLPAYITTGDFVTTLFDIITRAGTDASPLMQAFGSVQAEFDKIQNTDQKKLAKEDWAAILKSLQMVAGSQVGQAALDSLKFQVEGYLKKYPELQGVVNQALPKLDEYFQQLIVQQDAVVAPDQAKPSLTLQQLRLGLVAIDNASPHLTETLKALLVGIEESVKQGDQVIAQVRTNFESWYNNSMDRLIGMYKRKTQIISFIVGLLLAFLLNVDSITVATQMWREPTLRQAIIAQAETYVQENPSGSSNATDDTGSEGNASPTATESITELQNNLRELRLPFGWFGEPIPISSDITACRLTDISVDTNEDGVNDALFGMKFGNTCYPITNASPLNSDYILNWLVKLLGLALTGAAATQGAPFWFDMLKNVLKVNVRSVGPKPEEK